METVIKYNPPYSITKNFIANTNSDLSEHPAIVTSLQKHLNFSEELFIIESFDIENLNGKFIQQLIATGNIFDVTNLRDYFFGIHKSLAADGFYIGFAERKKTYNFRRRNKKARLTMLLHRCNQSFHFVGKKLTDLTRKRYSDLRKEKDNPITWSGVFDCLFDAGFRVTDFTEENNVLMFVAKKYRHTSNITSSAGKKYAV